MTTNVGNRRGARWKTITACAVAAWALASAARLCDLMFRGGLDYLQLSANPVKRFKWGGEGRF